jgi:hypothetical protein
MPVGRDYSSTNRTAENGLLGSEGNHCPEFSPEGTWVVRFQGEHQVNEMRSQAGNSATSDLTLSVH